MQRNVKAIIKTFLQRWRYLTKHDLPADSVKPFFSQAFGPWLVQGHAQGGSRMALLYSGQSLMSEYRLQSGLAAAQKHRAAMQVDQDRNRLPTPDSSQRSC